MDEASDAPRVHSRSYTRMVTVLKYVLPATALALVAIVIVWSHLRPGIDRFRVGETALQQDDAEEHTLIDARYVGVDRKGQPFSISAETVAYLDPEGTRVRLQTPEAEMTLVDGAWVAVTADDGLYDRETGSLGLTGAVSMFHDAGYQVRTTEAIIDLDAGTAAGSEPIEVQGQFGELSAEGFRVADGGGTIFFAGPAVLHLPADGLAAQP